MIYQRSSALFAEAKKVIPGGVNSPVRAFKAVGGDPVFIERAEGAYIYDEDGNLIAITSMAKPIKKTLNDEFTFKMKLDL